MVNIVRIVVEWDRDVDGVADIHADLPDEVEVPEDVYEEGMVTDGAVEDYLSDTFGFTVKDWRLA